MGRSRVKTTKNLLESLFPLTSQSKLEIFVQTSATGYYPSSTTKQERPWEETDSPGKNFLSLLCQEWEKVFLEKIGSVAKRWCLFRVGICLDFQGGMLASLIPLCRFSLGSSLGSGQQGISWIHLFDLCRVYRWALENPMAQGIYNAVSPSSVSHEFFMTRLRFFCEKKSLLPPPPSLFLQWALKEKSSLILEGNYCSTRLPTSLFSYSNLDFALAECCGFVQKNPHPKKRFHYQFFNSVVIERPLPEVFAFFSSAQNLEKITPPLLNFKILSQSTTEIKSKTEFVYRLKVHQIPIKWKTIIENFQENHSFSDYQDPKQGPYQAWHHTHEFMAISQTSCLMTDKIYYRLPCFAPEALAYFLVKKDIEKIFKYRNSQLNNFFPKRIQ